MDADPEQERFRALFSELRHADQHAAPSFERTWQAVTDRRMDRRREVGTALLSSPRWRLAAAVSLAAAGIVFAVLVGLRGLHHHSSLVRGTPPAPAKVSEQASGQPIAFVAPSSISEWQSPTAFLLDRAVDDVPLSRPTTEPSDAQHRSQEQRHL